MTVQKNEKDWWEKPLGLLGLGIVITVIGGFILWLVLRPFDKPASSSVPVPSPVQKQSEPTVTKPSTGEAPSANPAPAPPKPVVREKKPTEPVTGTKTPAPVPTQSCPNGICIGGDNNGSAKVENYNGIYPPPNVTPTISICAKPSVREGEIYRTTFVFKTDTEISNPAWWFLFDGPVMDIDVNANPRVIGFMHSHPPCDQIPMCDKSLGITLNNIGGLGSQLPWGPTIPFTAVVTSKQPVRLLEEHGRSMDKPLNENFVDKCD